LWVDDVSFLTAAPAPAPAEPVAVEEAVEPESEQVEEAEEETGNGRSGLCPGSMMVGVTAVVAAAWVTTNGKRRPKKRLD
jgi:hypothetical protein